MRPAAEAAALQLEHGGHRHRDTGGAGYSIVAGPGGHVTLHRFGTWAVPQDRVAAAHVAAVSRGHVLGRFHLGETARGLLRALDAAHDASFNRNLELGLAHGQAGRPQMRPADSSSAHMLADHLQGADEAGPRSGEAWNVGQKIRDRLANWRTTYHADPETAQRHAEALQDGHSQVEMIPTAGAGRYVVRHADHRGTPPTAAEVLHWLATEPPQPQQYARYAKAPKQPAGEGGRPRRPRGPKPQPTPPGVVPPGPKKIPALPPAAVPPTAAHVPEPQQPEAPHYRPGEFVSDREGHFEPEHEPDLGEFIHNRFQHDYGEQDVMNHGTGYLLRDGRPVNMGPGMRYEDHRAALPSLAAMKRWGWPEHVTKAYEESTRGPALDELLKRSGALRIHSSPDTLAVDSRGPITSRQRRVLLDHIVTHGPRSIILDLPHGGGESSPFGGSGAQEFGPHDVDAIEEHLMRHQYARARYARTAADTRGLAQELLRDIGGTKADGWHRKLYYAALRKTGSIGAALDLLAEVLRDLPPGYMEARRARHARGPAVARYAEPGEAPLAQPAPAARQAGPGD